MNKKLMHMDNLYNFNLVRYEPNSIILLDKHSRKPFQFYQSPNLLNLQPDLTHSFLLRPILYKNGALYEKASQTLASLIETRRRAYNPIRYTIQQIRNTFQPVLQCLEFVHQKDVVYGNFSSQHIVFFQNGQIMVKDWLFKKLENQNYSHNKDDDMKALGYILASASTLITENQLSKLTTAELISMMIQNYSCSFCSAVIILIEGISKYYSSVLGLINNSSNEVKIPQIKSFMNQAIDIKQLREKEKQMEKRLNEQKETKQKLMLLKQVQNQKIKIQTPKRDDLKNQNPNIGLNNQNANQMCSTQGSPTKKFNITTPNKKIIRLEDCQNKKVFNQEVKKRQIEKITKIIQRSNAFVNELMARKNNDKKLLNTAKLNSSTIEPQYTKKSTAIKQSPKVGSPSKRLRSISKKK